MLSLLFPQKCILCRSILKKGEHILCTSCRSHQPEFRRAKRNIPFIAQWTALWYYKDNVRPSIRRFKFYNGRSYAEGYAELLAEHLRDRMDVQYDLLSWVPVSPLRRMKRGYDQAKLLVTAFGHAVGIRPVRTLRKVRHTPPQSTIRDPAKRRANVLGAYRVTHPELIRGKRILLLDDVVTTGATASECAKTLLTAGAKEVIFAAVAAAD